MIHSAHFKELPEQKKSFFWKLVVVLGDGSVCVCVCVYMRVHSAMLSLFYKWDS